jgi:pSer/pThr/pTyr-binding forkhead associated (FHA) protein
LLEGVNVIGRAVGAAIPIDAPGVSRHHARIVVTHGEAAVEDLGSKNGTHVDGSRITTPWHLSDGNEIRLGTVVLTFRVGSQMSPPETVPTNSA